MEQSVSLKVFADYNQFYIWDREASDQMAPEDWTDEDVEARAKATPHVFVLSPVRNVEVPFVLEIHDSEPQFMSAEWDHIVEASIEIPSGQLEVHECTGGSLCEFRIDPGTYRVRALYKNLDSLSDDGLEGNDSYKATLWKAGKQEFRVLKAHI